MELQKKRTVLKKFNHLELLPVEDGIPIPEINRNPRIRRNPQYLYGLERLEVGQSIYIPDALRPPLAAISMAKRKLGRLFVFRMYRNDEGAHIGCRVWRYI